MPPSAPRPPAPRPTAMRAFSPAARGAAALALLAAAPLATAQVNPDLPSLTPREFEIRGTVQVDLPQIERQPLSGFGPPPRNFVVPAERLSIVGPYSPDVSTLPALVIPAPQPPEIAVPDLRSFGVQGAFGNSLSRSARLDLAVPVASGRLVADLDYEGVGDQAEPDYVTFDRASGHALIETGGRVRVGVEGHGEVDRYSVPAALVPNLDPPLRRRVTAGGGAWIRGTGGRTPFRIAGSYGTDRLEPAFDPTDVLGDAQTAAYVDGEVVAGLGRLRVDGAGGLLGLSGGLSDDARYVGGGAAVLLGNPGGVELTLGGRFLAYDASLDNGDGYAQVGGPIVDLTLPLGPALRVFAENDPHVRPRSLSTVTAENPYVLPGPVVVPELVPVDSRAGVEVRAGFSRIRAFAHLRVASAGLFFEDTGGPLFAENYAATQVQGVTGELALESRGGSQLTASLTVQEGSLREGGELPFLSPIVARGGVQLPIGRARIGASAFYGSARPVDRAGSRDADAYASLSLNARFDLTSAIALIAEADRLFGDEIVWPGAPLPAASVRGGLRLGL